MLVVVKVVEILLLTTYYLLLIACYLLLTTYYLLLTTYYLLLTTYYLLLTTYYLLTTCCTVDPGVHISRRRLCTRGGVTYERYGRSMGPLIGEVKIAIGNACGGGKRLAPRVTYLRHAGAPSAS